MAFTSNFHFSLLFSFTLLLLVQSKLTLLPYDHNALYLILKDFNIRHALTKNPCESTGIFCERRVLNNTYVLRVTRLVFESQQLNGRISPAIRQLSELKELSLPNNQLVDQIPYQIVDCQKLEIINVSQNKFTGEIPSGLSSLIRLRVLDLSSNGFVGNMKFLKHFPNLEKLNLADNMFSGIVPKSVKSFRNLRFIDISGNSLIEGQLPLMKQIEGFSLDKDNDDVPKRYVLVESSNASVSNSTLAPSSSDPPAPSPSGAAGSGSSQGRRHRLTRRRIGGWVLGFFAGVLAGIISGMVCSLLFKLVMYFIRGHGKDTSLSIYSPMIKKAEDLAFLQKEDGLASLSVIGKGGCGEVYKGVLASTGKEIAIKKVIQPAVDAEDLTDEDSRLLTKKMRQIKSEINTVGQIRHRNLLALLAHMPQPDCHYLVYEYMKNGSLQDFLQDGRELDWLARYKIALGVASGLEYLHLDHSPRIIHRDLKPGNILLDDDMEARIADFGLAKAVPDSHTHVSTSNVVGTLGYIAPEYHQTNKFTDKSDIYSFGVVLGVLVMGKLPSDKFFQVTDEMNMTEWVRNVIVSDDPKRAIDPKLMGNGYEEQMLLVLKVACFCTLRNPKERPNSKDARCMLSQIKH